MNALINRLFPNIRIRANMVSWMAFLLILSLAPAWSVLALPEPKGDQRKKKLIEDRVEDFQERKKIEPRPLRAEDIPRIGLGVASARISADGRKVAYVQYGLRQPEPGRLAVIWIHDRKTGQYINLARGIEPRWAPNGRWLAYLEPASHGFQIFLGDPETRTLKWLTDISPGLKPSVYGPTFSWTRASDRIAFTIPTEKSPTLSDDRGSGSSSRGRLAVVHLATSEIKTLIETEDALGGCQWSPDEKSIVFQVIPSGKVNPIELREYSFEDGSVHDLLGSGARGFDLSIGPGQSGIGFLALTTAALHFDPMPPFMPSVIQMPLRHIRRLADRHGFGPMSWGPGGLDVYQSLATGAGAAIYRIALDGGALTPVSPAAGSFYAPDAGGNGQWIAAIGEDFDSLPEAWLLKADGSEAIKISRVSTRLERYRLGKGETVHWKAPDGVELNGLLIMPAVSMPDRSRPLIVDLAGGPGPSRHRFNAHWQYFAGRGYAVFVPNHRLTGAYGSEPMRRSQEPGRKERFDQIADDVISGVKAIVSRGVADPRRLALRGYSSGAEAALWIQDRSPLFAAAALTEPLNPPGENENVRIRRPTIFFFGEKNPSVAQARAMAEAATRSAGVQAEVIVRPGQGHIPTGSAAIIEIARRTAEWFDRHLGVQRPTEPGS